MILSILLFILFISFFLIKSNIKITLFLIKSVALIILLNLYLLIQIKENKIKYTYLISNCQILDKKVLTYLTLKNEMTGICLLMIFILILMCLLFAYNSIYEDSFVDKVMLFSFIFLVLCLLFYILVEVEFKDINTNKVTKRGDIFLLISLIIKYYTK